MLTPAYLRGASDSVVEVFAQVEQDTTSDIARRIVKTRHMTETAQWQLEKAQQIGMLQGDVKRTLATATGKSKAEISKIMTEAGAKSLKFDDSIYRAAGLNPTPIGMSPVIQTILLQGVDDTMMLVRNFTKTMAIASTSAFTSSLDRAYIKILSGAFDRNTALKMAIKELSSKGIEKIAYPSGHYSSMDAAVRRAVSTGLNQSVSKLQLTRADEMGCNLVETTSHAGARPSHAEWQGMVFCIKGHNKTYGNFYRETGYGTGDGLCGWNCYHNFFPFFEGLSVLAFDHDPSTRNGHDNDEDYELQQKQRYYERRIRESKRECVTINAAMTACDDEELQRELYEDFQRASVKLKQRESTLKQFIEQTQRTRLNDREWSAGFNRSISSKAVWANRKARR